MKGRANVRCCWSHTHTHAHAHAHTHTHTPKLVQSVWEMESETREMMKRSEHMRMKCRALAE